MPDEKDVIEEPEVIDTVAVAEEEFAEAFNESETVEENEEAVEEEQEVEEHQEDEETEEIDQGAEDQEVQGEAEETAPAAEVKDVPDIWASADPAAKQAFEDSVSSAQEWEHKYKSDQGRFLAAQKAIQDPMQTTRSHIAQKATEALADPEKWNEFKEDYADIATAMEAKFTHERETLRAEVLQEVQAPINHLRQAENQRNIQSSYAVLDAAHDDWRNVVNSDDFKGWIEEQPQTVKQMMSSKDAADAVYLLDNFKRLTVAPAVAETETNLQTQRKQRLKASVSAPTKGARTKPKSMPNDFDAVFAAIT